MISWMLANMKDNPLYAKFNRVAAILKKYDVVLSLGNGIRAGAIHDSSDRAQVAELVINCELAEIGQEMSKARRDMQWGRQFELGLFGPLAKRIRASRTPEDEATCTMCGDFCAAKNAGALYCDHVSAEKR